MRNLREYLWANSPAEALRLFADRQGTGAYLGGGAALMARSDPALDFVVDLSRAGLEGLEADVTGITIGAAVPLQDLLEALPASTIGSGLLAAALRSTRTELWRRQATLAGRLLEADPTDRVAAALLVLEAEATLCRPEEPTPFRRHLADLWAETARAGTLVVSVHVPRPTPGWGFAQESVARAALDAPLAVVAAGVQVDGNRVTQARIATSGLLSPRRAPATEAALGGSSIERFDAALAAFEQDLAPADDWRASADTRLHLARVLLGRALRAAVTAAREGMKSR